MVSSQTCVRIPFGEECQYSYDSPVTQNAWHYIPNGTPEWPAEKIETLMAQHCPLGRCAVPEDVARVVGFLASEDGGWVNGMASYNSEIYTS